MFCSGKTARPPTVTDTGEEMAALLLLSLWALLFTTNAQDAYDKLPETYRKGVDLALEKIHSHAGVQHHFLFFRSVTKSEAEPGFGVTYFYHHFHLRATKCQKGTTDSTSCQFRNDRALIDCAVCYKTFRGEIEQDPKPYVHCIHRPALTEEMKTERVTKCNSIAYSNGAGSILASGRTE